MRELKEPRTSYDGPKKAKKIDLAEPREEPKPAYIATDLTEEEEQLLIATLKQYKDVFAWSYKDLKGVDPSICQHTIPLKRNVKPSRQRPYTYNETFARKIKEEIDKLKEAEFIYEIEHTDWVSPIVVVPKKNGKLRVCVNLKKVNKATIRDNYPLPITDHVIERVTGREAYSFLDGFSRYNQLAIKLEDQHKTAFATEWGIFAYRVMPFGLTNVSTTFQRMPRQKTARQWDKAPYEVDELSTNEKSHIPDEVLAQIPAHIFITKFKDEEGDNIKTTIMPREIWTLHRRPEVASAIKAVHLEHFFRLPPWGTDYMRAHELMSSIQYDGKTMLTDNDGVKESAQEDVPKEVEATDPSEYKKSDQEDTLNPLEKRSQKPRSREQVLMDEAMARVEARRKELADARAAKAAKTTRPMTLEEARKIRIEKAKAIQKERKRIEAEATQAVQTQEKELAREKIKEALSRKAEEPILEPTQGSPKRPRQEEEEDIEHIQADPIPPSPINIPLAPPSSPITPFPPASTPRTSPSPSPLDLPKSSPAPTSPQQQQFSAEPI
ncbi:hypothetical protein L7F22_030580 [Adiantum nelumboides]|nr:hypothetical protein [Adiantum nelumboides]